LEQGRGDDRPRRSDLARPADVAAAACNGFVFRSVDRFPTIFLRSPSPHPRHFPFFSDRRTEHEGSWTLARRMRALPTAAAATTGQKSKRRTIIRVRRYRNSTRDTTTRRYVVRLVRDTMSIAGVRRRLRFTLNADK